DSASPGCRFALELLRFDRWNQLPVWIIGLIRWAQFLEDTLPSFVADFGKVWLYSLHRRSAHGIDCLSIQREKIFDLVDKGTDIAPWRDVSVLSLSDQVPGTVSDVVHDGNATCPHRLHH